MLDYDQIVFRLRELCPLFNGRVFGSAEFDDALKALEEGKTTLAVPSAYVHTLGLEPGENTLLNSLQQEVEEAFVVNVYLDNSQDRAGRTAASKFPVALQQLNNALLNWNALPDRTRHPVVFAGGQLLASHRARAVYEFTYRITWYLTAEDGFDEASQPLVSITLTDPDRVTAGTQKITLEQ